MWAITQAARIVATLAFISIATSGVATKTHGAQPSSASDLLKKYDNFVSGLRTLKFDCTDTRTERGGRFRDWTWIATTKSRFVRRDDRWRLRTHTSGINYVEDKAIVFESEFENTLANDRNFYALNLTYKDIEKNNRSYDEHIALDRMAKKEGRIFETGAGIEIEAKSKEAKDGFATQNETNIIYGHMPYDNKMLVELMHEGELSVDAKMESVGGHDTHVVRSRGPHGLFLLYLDPGADYAPLRIVNVKHEDDYLGETKISAIRHESNPAMRWPDKPMRGIIFDVYFTAAKVDKGRVFIGAYTRNDTWLYDDNEKFEMRDQVTLSDVDFDPPSSELNRTIEIPDGTPVAIRNAPWIEAVWEGGKLVKQYDKKVISGFADLEREREIAQQQTGTQRRAPIATVALVNAGVILLVALVWGWRRYRRRLT